MAGVALNGASFEIPLKTHSIVVSKLESRVMVVYLQHSKMRAPFGRRRGAGLANPDPRAYLTRSESRMLLTGLPNLTLIPPTITYAGGDVSYSYNNAAGYGDPANFHS